MDLRLLRKRCEGRLEQLELPVPLTARSFCAKLAAKRGRPIHLHAVTTRAGPWGLWIAGPSADFIFYEQGTSPLHQEHIILHEACHLLCGHRPVSIGKDEYVRLLFPDLAPETIWCVLRRATYTADEEREAEFLASLILERANRLVSTQPPVAAAPTDLPGRLAASLEDTSGSTGG